MSARSYIITGRVQGVFYRARTKQRADELGIVGWVRNGNDGVSVEVHAEGSDEQLAALEEWLRVGPPAADVQDVNVKNAKTEHCTTFEVRYF